MKWITGYGSDKGISKTTNQDSLCLKEAGTSEGKVLLAMICDGMGGLAKGELASATVVQAFSRWFEEEFPRLLEEQAGWEKLEECWRQLIRQSAETLRIYGIQKKVRLGTTMTAMLMMRGNCLTAHVGDSRIYLINQEISRLTEDHTFVNREVKAGRMTRQQADRDSRRNVLLQCIGASEKVEPEMHLGQIRTNSTYLLCSDGFRHEITEQELQDRLQPQKLRTEEAADRAIRELTGLAEQRQEKDNISAIVISVAD